MTFRDALPDDVPVIAALIRESKARAMPWLPVLHSLAEDEGWVAGMLASGHRIRLATSATADAEILGVIVTSPGWVNHLYVAAPAQGRGIGGALLRHAQAESVEPLQLWAFQQNVRARAFYEAHGFVSVRMTDGDNEEQQPDVLYRWMPSEAASAGSGRHHSEGSE